MSAQQREHYGGDHEHGVHRHGHHHSHGTVDPALVASDRGIRAVQWSLAGLAATALFQLAVVAISGSVALLADTIHNFGDASTALPLWAAFALSHRRPNRRFTYGYGRWEDLAGLVIVLTILATALLAGYESFHRLLYPQPIQHLGAVVVASLVGFLGNEGVALFRLRVGREISSAALVADGYHARADGLTSLSVLVGALGMEMGFPLADPVVGLLITGVILRAVWESGKTVFARLLDGVDPQVVEEIERTVQGTPGVRRVGEVRVRWVGHRLHAEVNLAVSPHLSVGQGHDIAREAWHRLLHRLQYLSNATIHVDPVRVCGEEYHRIQQHAHGGLPPHSHWR